MRYATLVVACAGLGLAVSGSEVLYAQASEPDRQFIMSRRRSGTTDR